MRARCRRKTWSCSARSIGSAQEWQRWQGQWLAATGHHTSGTVPTACRHLAAPHLSDRDRAAAGEPGCPPALSDRRGLPGLAACAGAPAQITKRVTSDEGHEPYKHGMRGHAPPAVQHAHLARPLSRPPQGQVPGAPCQGAPAAGSRAASQPGPPSRARRRQCPPHHQAGCPRQRQRGCPQGSQGPPPPSPGLPPPPAARGGTPAAPWWCVQPAQR